MSVELSILLDGNPPDPKLGIVQARIVEGMNRITLVELILASGKSDLEPPKYVGHKATIKFGDPRKTPEFENRYDGLISRFGGNQQPWAGNSLFAYKVLIRPWHGSWTCTTVPASCATLRCPRLFPRF